MARTTSASASSSTERVSSPCLPVVAARMSSSAWAKVAGDSSAGVDDVGVGEDLGAEAGAGAHLVAGGVEEVGQRQHLVVLVGGDGRRGVRRCPHVGAGDVEVARRWAHAGPPGPGRAPARWRGRRGRRGATRRRESPSSWRGVRECQPSASSTHETDARRRSWRARTPRRPAPAAVRGPRCGWRRRRWPPRRRPSSSPSASTTPSAWSISTGTRSERPDAQRLADRVDEREGQVDLARAPCDVAERDVLRDGGDPGELGGPLVGGEPRQLEDDAVAGRRGVATASPA